MRVDPLNLFKHFSFLTSMLLQMQAVSPATLEPLCHKDPACKSLSAPPVTGSHSTSGAALLASYSKTRWATRSKSADTLTVSAAHHNLCSCKVTLLYFYILYLSFFSQNESLWLLDLLGESFCRFKSTQQQSRGCCFSHVRGIKTSLFSSTIIWEIIWKPTTSVSFFHALASEVRENFIKCYK